MLATIKTYYQKNRKERLAYAKDYRKQNPELTIERDRRYAKKRKEKQTYYYQKWYAKNGRNRTDADKERILKYNQFFPERVKANKMVRACVWLGHIVKPDTCTYCKKNKRVQAHHINYDHYLNFIWLCGSCHKLVHLGGIEIKFGERVPCKIDPSINPLTEQMRIYQRRRRKKIRDTRNP